MMYYVAGWVVWDAVTLYNHGKYEMNYSRIKYSYFPLKTYLIDQMILLCILSVASTPR